MSTDATPPQRCANCQLPVEPSDVVYCSVCGQPHHAACWNVIGHCATPGCPGIQAIRAQTPGSAMPPPPPIIGTSGAYYTGMSRVFEVGLSPAFTIGWEAFSRYMAVGIVAILLYLVISFAIGFIVGLPSSIMEMALVDYGPLVQFATNIGSNLIMGFIEPPLIGGLVIVALNMLTDNNPSVGDFFAGFRRYWPLVGAYWLLLLVNIVAFIPFFICLAYVLLGLHWEPAYGTLPPEGAIALLVISALLSTVLYCYLLIRWAFVYFLVIEGDGVLDAFRNSALLTDGLRLRLFGISFVLGLVAGLGLLVCCVPVIFTGAFALCAFASQYLALRYQRLRPAGV